LFDLAIEFLRLRTPPWILGGIVASAAVPLNSWSLRQIWRCSERGRPKAWPFSHPDRHALARATHFAPAACCWSIPPAGSSVRSPRRPPFLRADA